MALPATADILFLLLALPAALIDQRSGRIPDILSLPLIAALLTARLLPGEHGLAALAIGLAGAPLMLFMTSRRGGIGGGDLKLAAAVGLYLPGFGWIPALAVAALTGLALYALRRGPAEAGKRIPFGPCLVAGAAAVRITEMLLL